MYTYAHCAGFGCISRISIDYVFFFFSWAVLITWFARHLQEGMEEQEEDSEEHAEGEVEDEGRAGNRLRKTVASSPSTFLYSSFPGLGVFVRPMVMIDHRSQG